MSRSLLFVFAPILAMANPVGESVAKGSAVFDRASPQMLQVEAEGRAIIDWDSFSIGEGELTRFVQAGKDAAVLNRVLGGELSEIYGQLESNGQIFLVNPHGVLIGATGLVDCASFLAAAFEMDEGSFLQGRDFVFKNGGDVKAVNLGTIRTSSGPVFLIGPDVENQGVMTAGSGQAYMISGDEITLSSFDDPRVLIRPTAASFGKIDNKGLIEAADVHLLGALAVNNGGRIEATGVERVGGRIFLTGGAIESSGELVAEAGRIELEGGEVVLTEGSVTDVSSWHGGGEVHLKSEYRTLVLEGAEVAADALMEGNGGRVLVLSDQWAGLTGRISARGGMIRGDGGFVELSARGGMALGGTISTEASFGTTGNLLIDPTDVTIGPGGMNNAMAMVMVMGMLVDSFTYSGTPVIIDDSAFQSGGYIDSNNVTVYTGNMVDQGEAGDITIAGTANLNWSSSNTLTLIADRDIAVISGAVISPTGGGSLVAQAKNNISVDTIIASTGSITLRAGPLSGLSGFDPTGSVTFGSSGILSTFLGVGSILVEGYDITSTLNSIFASSSGGITFQASHDLLLMGDPVIAFTDTGFVRFYADRNATVFGTITAMGAFAGNQIDVRADTNLDGDGNLRYEAINGLSTNWTTMSGGNIFLGGNNVTLLGVQGTTQAGVGDLSLSTSGGGTIEIQATTDFLMQGGTPSGMMNGNARVFMTAGGDVSIRTGNDIIFQGGSADVSDVLIVGSGGECEVIAGNDIQLLGGSGATTGFAFIAHDQLSLTAGNNISFTAGMGTGPGASPNNATGAQSDVSPTLIRAGGNILFTNGPTNGLSFGYAGVVDNGIGFDIRAAGSIQFAQSARPTGTESIYIAANASISPLWAQQFGPYLTSTALAAAATATASGSGAYTVLTSPMPGGVEFVTVDGQITLYSGPAASLLLDDTTTTNATRLASTTGNIQVASFLDTNVNNTVITGGAILIATNNNLNINVPAGFVSAGGPITLIVDQQSPDGNGGGFFNNFNSGISTTDPQGRIAIYAASGPTPGSGFSTIANQVVLGNLSSVETWDAGESLGLLSKYDTSYEDGGLVHGTGFGTSYVAGNGVFSSPVIWYKAFPISANLVDEGLEAMQQLSTLIPERLWIQEFSILVNRAAFKEAVKSLMRHRWKEKSMQPRIAIARSKDYFLRTTMAGDNIRITDYYQEFEQSPFWRNPRMMNRLRALKQEAMK